MRDVPVRDVLVGRARTRGPQWYTYTLVKDAQAKKTLSHPCLLLFVSFFHFTSPQVFPPFYLTLSIMIFIPA